MDILKGPESRLRGLREKEKRPATQRSARREREKPTYTNAGANRDGTVVFLSTPLRRCLCLLFDGAAKRRGQRVLGGGTLAFSTHWNVLSPEFFFRVDDMMMRIGGASDYSALAEFLV